MITPEQCDPLNGIAACCGQCPKCRYDYAEDAARAALARDKPDCPTLREVVESASFWLGRWAAHVGDCKGGDRCTCGLTAIRHELVAALNPAP